MALGKSEIFVLRPRPEARAGPNSSVSSLGSSIWDPHASIVSRDPRTARALIDVADRARRDLMLELLPVEQEVRDAVQRELRGIPGIDIAVDLSEGVWGAKIRFAPSEICDLQAGR